MQPQALISSYDSEDARDSRSPRMHRLKSPPISAEQVAVIVGLGRTLSRKSSRNQSASSVF